MTKTFGEVRKNQTESTNVKILGGPLHVMLCIVIVTMLASGHDRYDSVDQSVAVSALRVAMALPLAMLLTDATNRNIYHFRCKFSAAFDFRVFFSGMS